MGRKLTDKGGPAPPDPEDFDDLEDEDDDDDGVEASTPEGLDVSPDRRQRRSRMRPKTIAGRRLTRAEIQEGIELADDMWYERPKTRADCVNGLRPCPFVSCKYHLYLDVKDETRSIKLNFPHLEVWEMEHTCALDVAEQGGMTLEEVGHILNLTRERVRQVEVAGVDKLKQSGVVEDIDRIFGIDGKFD